MDFRVIATDLPNLAGVPAQVTVAFGGQMLVIHCQPEDVDPPEYTRLKRISAEQIVQCLESELATLEDSKARLEGQLKQMRVIADPLGEQKRQMAKIHGVGPKRSLALLKHFGSIEAIRQASVEELAAVKGMNKRAAAIVGEALWAHGGAPDKEDE